MSTNRPMTVERVRDLVMSNRAIRAPHYHAGQAGIQWGEDIIPGLLGLFRIEKDVREDLPTVGSVLRHSRMVTSRSTRASGEATLCGWIST